MKFTQLIRLAIAKIICIRKGEKLLYNGVINVYKEKGFTSHDVVAKMRGILKQKKIGHTGTLDPDAEGVLPVCLGSGTKLCDMLTDKSKEVIILISWLQSPSAVILEPKNIKSATVSIVFPAICHEMMGPDATIFFF